MTKTAGHRKPPAPDIEAEMATLLESLSPMKTADAVSQLDAARKSCIVDHADRDMADWFHVATDSCAFLGRRDGTVTVHANSGGYWLVRAGRLDAMVSEKIEAGAVAAVEAAVAFPGVKA